MPATAGGSTIGSSTIVIASERPRNRREARNHAVGVPKAIMTTWATKTLFRLMIERVGDDRVRHLVQQRPERHVDEDRDDRQHDEREGERDRGEVERAEAEAHDRRPDGPALVDGSL